MSLLSLEAVETRYAPPGGVVRAVDRVSLSVARGEALGLVGESGCGKSTLGKTVLGLVPASGGRIAFDGQDITHLTRGQRKALRRRMQMVFQDPAASLNPRHSIRQILEGPLKLHKVPRAKRAARIVDVLDRVGLSPDILDQYPHEFSGGQKQRIGIARALVLDPDLLICDEPVSALDVSVQAQILNLLIDLRASRAISYLFVSHDLGVVQYIADRVAVMYLGRIVETGPTAELFASPRHPYTRALFAAVPGTRRDADGELAQGDLPAWTGATAGCRYHPRCPLASDLCRSAEPDLQGEGGHAVACHHAQATPDIRQPEPVRRIS